MQSNESNESNKLNEWTHIPAHIVERDYKVEQYWKYDTKKETKRIYEIKRDEHYILIHRKNGKVISMTHDNNIIGLMLLC